MKTKSIWECSVTVHSSLKEKTNTILLELAKDKQCQKSRVLQSLIETHPEYLKMQKKLEAEDFFI